MINSHSVFCPNQISAIVSPAFGKRPDYWDILKFHFTVTPHCIKYLNTQWPDSCALNQSEIFTLIWKTKISFWPNLNQFLIYSLNLIFIISEFNLLFLAEEHMTFQHRHIMTVYNILNICLAFFQQASFSTN